MTDPQLRPLTRTVVRLDRAGMPASEIAWRLRRSPGHIGRILSWSELPRPLSSNVAAGAGPMLRPVERRVLQAREDGVERSEIAARLRRSPEHVARIEQFAALKLATA